MNHTGATSCTSCHTTTGNGFTPAKANHISTTGYAQCSSCHTTSLWVPTSFNHGGITSATDCTTCHNGTSASGRPTGTKAHVTAPMTANTCGNCHTIGTAWAPAKMNHTGATSCTSCHTTAGNGFTPAKANHISTTGYAQCSSCHMTTAWLPTSFNHSGITSASDCTTCHNGTAASGRPTGAKAHITAPMTSNTCGNCHSIGTAWTPATMNHTGATSCTSCHSTAGNGFTPAKTNHIPTTGYAQCSSCHLTTAWVPTNFSHTGITGNCSNCHNGSGATGPTSSHTGISPTPYQCNSCHRTTAWLPATFAHTGVTSGCTNCHKAGFASVKSASHFITTQGCEKCHTTTAWAPMKSYVHTSTYYKTHSGLSMTNKADCLLCHIGNNEVISGAPHRGSAAYKPDCAWCHSQQYKTGSHKKTQSPTTVYYTVAELKNCGGSCHEYTNNTFTTVKTSRTGHHKSTDGGF
jgi:predicted CXXCH cytochrome family protein